MDKQRVRDRVNGDLGTVVDSYGEGAHRRYRIAWDRPTPHQDRTWAEIPSQFFEWHDEDTGSRPGHDAQCEAEWVTGRWGGGFTVCGCDRRSAP